MITAPLIVTPTLMFPVVELGALGQSTLRVIAIKGGSVQPISVTSSIAGNATPESQTAVAYD